SRSDRYLAWDSHDACPLFFFSSRRRHTRSTRDWSSDVCSSDLATRFRFPACRLRDARTPRHQALRRRDRQSVPGFWPAIAGWQKIGRASCRERVWISGGGGSWKETGERGEREEVARTKSCCR